MPPHKVSNGFRINPTSRDLSDRLPSLHNPPVVGSISTGPTNQDMGVQMKSARNATPTQRRTLRLRDELNAPAARVASSMRTHEMRVVFSADTAQLVSRGQPIQPAANRAGQK